MHWSCDHLTEMWYTSTMRHSPLISFWCICTVMHVSRFVRCIRLRLVFSVIATISCKIVSAFLVALATAALSTLAANRAAWMAQSQVYGLFCEGNLVMKFPPQPLKDKIVSKKRRCDVMRVLRASRSIGWISYLHVSCPLELYSQ